MSPLLGRPASATLAVAFVVILPLAACQNAADPTPLRATSPRLEIFDGAHGIGGNPKFVWLPPTVPTTPSYSGTFASGLDPTVTVCLGTAPCPGSTVAHFTKAEGTGGARLAENTTSPSYRATWLSSSCDAAAYCPLVPGQTYRMTVAVAGTPLGYADIKIYRTLIEQMQDPNVKQYVPLLQGRPLGIAFRVTK